VTAGGSEVVPPTPLASVTAVGDDAEVLVNIPAEPVAVSGTLDVSAAVHTNGDLASLLTVETQPAAGPYNARAVSLIEGLDVLLDAGGPDVSLLTAAVVRSEAAAVCAGTTVTYTGNSEIVDLRVAGTSIPLNGPVQDLIDAISGVLQQTGLNAVVDVQRNVVNATADGVSVDALVVTVLAAAGADPLARVVIGHAEASGVTCGPLPECSDTVDNDGDGFIDFPNDPDCDSPADDDESPECSDELDNDGDGLIDFPNDPGCDSPQDDDERDAPGIQSEAPRAPSGPLARTGPSGPSTALALALGLAGVAGLAARRRFAS
jgi:hypothetical protein